jgi:hypothetical protein
MAVPRVTETVSGNEFYSTCSLLSLISLRIRSSVVRSSALLKKRQEPNTCEESARMLAKQDKTKPSKTTPQRIGEVRH